MDKKEFMNLLELHILQSFPVSCLNRDDVGSPKTAIFGGENRARISSQCLKRAIREHAQLNFPRARFNGQRTCFVIEPLKQALQKYGMDEEAAKKHAYTIADLLSGLDAKSVKEGKKPKVTTLLFLSPAEIDTLAKKTVQMAEVKDAKTLAKFCKDVDLCDAADIALFGRMVAKDSSLTLEGAGMFSHALSTHRSENEIDFYSAVDDRKTLDDDAGAAMLGSLEFNSAVYYRYAALNLDLLFDENHLGKLASQERKELIDAFIRSTLMAIPKARRNSMNAHTLPSFVLGTIKKKGQPVQLINAFEKAVRAINGKSLIEASINRLKAHSEDLKSTWGIETVFEAILPEKSLNDFCSEMINHVQ